MKALITNARNRIAYAVLQSLAKHGIETHCYDFHPLSMNFFSRYCKKKYVGLSPFKNSKMYIEELISILKNNKYDVLIPIYEETFLISRFKEKISKYVNVVVPDYPSVLRVHNKDKLYRLANELNIDVPKTFRLEEVVRDKLKAVSLNYPVYIKPIQGGGSWGIKKISSVSDLKNINNSNVIPKNKTFKDFLVQEIINGDVLCCAILYNRGKYIASHSYKQIREIPIGAGTATCRVSIYNYEIIKNLKKLLDNLRWHGVCQADFLIDDKTGKLFLIDVNPRFWGGLFQAIYSGVDFPYLVCRIAMGDDRPFVGGYKTGVKTRWICGDLKWISQWLTSRTKKNYNSLKEFLKVNKHEGFEDLSLRDPLPLFICFIDHFNRIISQGTINPKPPDSLAGIWD